MGLTDVKIADKSEDAEMTAVVCLAAEHATGVAVGGLHCTNSDGRASTGSMSASSKKALVSGSEEGAFWYFVFERVGEYFSASCLLSYIFHSATPNGWGTDLLGPFRSKLQG